MPSYRTLSYRTGGVLTALALLGGLLLVPPIRAQNGTRPELALSLNQLPSEDTLRVGLTARNPGPPVTADFYLGILLPDGVTVLFITSLSPLTWVEARLDADPRTFRPLFTNQQLASGLNVTYPELCSLPITAGVPPGVYAVVTFLTPPGGVLDGRINVDDLLAFDIQPFSINP
jgi:hypothetical protein